MTRSVLLAWLALAACTPQVAGGDTPGSTPLPDNAGASAPTTTMGVEDNTPVLLVVDDEPITRRDLFLTFNPQPLLGLEPNEYPPQQEDVLLERAVFRALVLSAAKKAGYLDPQVVSADEWLVYQNYLRDSILIKAFLEREVVGDIQPTPEEVAAFYTTNLSMFERPESRTTSHILVCHTESQGCEGERTKEEALAYANELRERALAGEEFAALAQEGSDGPSGPTGGSLGENSRGVFVPTFEAAAWALELGGISEAVETQFGYHIITVTAISAGDHIPLEDVAPLVTEQVRRVRAEEAVRAYVQSLQTAGVIEGPPPPAAADDSGE